MLASSRSSTSTVLFCFFISFTVSFGDTVILRKEWERIIGDVSLVFCGVTGLCPPVQNP